MNQNNSVLAETFYKAMAEKNIKLMEKYLHPDVQLITPMANLQGKEAYLDAVANFTAFFKTLSIRATFGDRDQAVVVYDLDCPEPIGKMPGVALMTFKNGLITRNELFHDTSPFAKIMGDLSA